MRYVDAGLSQASNAQIVKVPTKSAITKNDLVVLDEGGYAFSANQNLSVSNLNNNTRLAPISPLKGTANYGTTRQGMQTSMCELANGNIVHIFTGDGTSSIANYLNIQIKTPLGVVVSTRVLAQSLNSSCTYSVRKINANKFAIIFTDTNNYVKFAVYANNGDIVKDVTTVASVYNTTCNAVANKAGQLITFYNKTSTGDFCFQVFDEVGAVVKTETIIEAGAKTDQISPVMLKSGGFAVCYHRSVATTATKLVKYDATFTLVGSIATVASSNSSLYYGLIDESIVELSNENIVILYSNTSGQAAVSVYSSTLVIVKQITILPSIYSGMLIKMNDGAFAIAMVGGTTLGCILVNIYDNNGVLINSFSTNGGINSPYFTNASILVSKYTGTGFLFMFRGAYSSDSTYYPLKMWRTDMQGNLIDTVVALYLENNTASLDGMYAFLSSYGIFYLAFNYSSTFYTAIYDVLKKSILGVASADATENTKAQISITGAFDINQTFAMGGNFDARANTVGGNRGFIAGSSVLLYGVS